MLGGILKILGFIYVIVLIGFVLYIQQVDRKFVVPSDQKEFCDINLLINTNLKIHDSLNALMKTTFFRFLKINLESACPFWAQSNICNSRGCTVCRCEAKDIPPAFLNETKTDLVKETSKKPHIKFSPDEFMPEDDDWNWRVEEFETDTGSYVDLRSAEEGYTGYSNGSHVWEQIHNANCFSGKAKDLCYEERAFNRIINGLHTSISSHIYENFVDFKKNISHFYPNHELYFKTVGGFSERILDLYYYYSVLLRAINVATPKLREYAYDTGNSTYDNATKNKFIEILDITTGECEGPFQEQEFQQTFKKNLYLKNQIQNYIHNISRLMDCVQCEKCKLFAKMQVYGIGTAFKILFSKDPYAYLHKINRNELVSLLNTFTMTSFSVKIVNLMFERRYQALLWKGINYLAIGASVLAFLWILYYFFLSKKCQPTIKNSTTQGNQTQDSNKKNQ